MTETDDQLRLCTFRLHDLYLGLDVRDVQEVLHHPDITSVPHADPAVRGLINLRGQIATTIDLRRRFGLPNRDDESRAIHVVVRPAGEWVSLLVDKIGDVIDVEPESYEAPPETLEGSARDLILGAYKLTDELLLMVDISAAVALASVPEERV